MSLSLPRRYLLTSFVFSVAISIGVPALSSSNSSAAEPPTGLTAEYFPVVDLQGPSVRTVVESTVSFNWGRGAPIGLPINQFSARFRGGVVAPTTGVYAFFVTGDDGVRLNVNDVQVLNDWSDHAAREAKGTIELVAGQAVPLQLEYYERNGLASLKLEWSGPGVTRAVIPAAQLLPVFNDAVEPPTTADTFYVATTGDDENPGTSLAPWRTIQKAARTLAPGQTVLVADGTYDDETRMERSGAPGQYITFSTAPGAKPVVRITTPDAYGFRVVGASYVRVKGFDVSYQGPDASTNKAFAFAGGMRAVANNDGVIAHHIEFIGNSVHDFPGEGIAAGEADYLLIQGNTVWNNSKWNPYQTSGISMYQTVNADYAAGFHNVIRGNIVFQNENRVPNDDANPSITDGNCIILDDQRRHSQTFIAVKQGSYEGDTLIENNVCAGNGGRGVHILNSDNVLVRNNTFYNNLRTSSLPGGELTAHYFYDPNDPNQELARRAPVRRGNVRFVNNLVVSNRIGAQYATNDDRDLNNVVFERNFYVGTAPATADGGSVQNSRAPDDILSNIIPLVAPNENAFQGDFRLKPNSEPIDAARAESSPGFDQTGFSRPFGGGFDIGAFEWR